MSDTDTIVRRLAQTNPWKFDEWTRSWLVPMHTCMYCDQHKPVNEHNLYRTHTPDCLWVAAARYADDPDTSPVSPQEATESPIESRVSELLADNEINPEIAAAHQAIPTWRLV